MASRREYRLVPVLLLLAAIGCDGGEPLAPSFLVVSAPGNLTASAVSFSQIALAWEDNSRNESGFEVYRSTTGSAGPFTFIGNAGPLATAYNDAGLSGLTAYCYQVRAYRVTGKRTTYSDFSAVACATTPRSPVPAAPSGINAAPYYGWAIRVAWTDNSTDETGFRVERSTGATGPWTTRATLYANERVLFDNVLLEESACYRVFAFNSYGDSDPAGTVCTALPTAPNNLAASVVGTDVDLTWTDNSGVEDGFEVLRTVPGVEWSVIATLAANTRRYHDASLSPDVTYSYFVRATRDGGFSRASDIVQAVVAISPPSAPVNLVALPWSSSNIGVYWTDASSNEEGFRVERSTDGGGNWLEAAHTGVDQSWFGDYPVPSEQAVCYRVIAFNHVGESPASNSDCTAPPAGPTDLIATGLDESTIQLDWTDHSQVEDGYEVWIDDGSGGQWPIASLGPSTTTFQYADYYAYYNYYFVVAVKDGGYSDWSNWAYATPPAGSARVRGSPPREFHAPRQRKLTGP